MPMTHEVKSPCVYRKNYPSQEELDSDALKDKVVLAPKTEEKALLNDINRYMGTTKIGETTIFELRMKELKFTGPEKKLVRLTQTEVEKMKLADLLKISPPGKKAEMQTALGTATSMIDSKLDELKKLEEYLSTWKKNDELKKLQAFKQSLEELKNSDSSNNLEKLEKSKKALADLKKSLEGLKNSAKKNVTNLDATFQQLEESKKPPTKNRIKGLENLITLTELPESSALISAINSVARSPISTHRENLITKTHFTETKTIDLTDTNSFDSFLKTHLLSKIGPPTKQTLLADTIVQNFHQSGFPNPAENYFKRKSDQLAIEQMKSPDSSVARLDQPQSMAVINCNKKGEVTFHSTLSYTQLTVETMKDNKSSSTAHDTKGKTPIVEVKATLYITADEKSNVYVVPDNLVIQQSLICDAKGKRDSFINGFLSKLFDAPLSGNNGFSLWPTQPNRSKVTDPQKIYVYFENDKLKFCGIDHRGRMLKGTVPLNKKGAELTTDVVHVLKEIAEDKRKPPDEKTQPFTVEESKTKEALQKLGLAISDIEYTSCYSATSALKSIFSGSKKPPERNKPPSNAPSSPTLTST